MGIKCEHCGINPPKTNKNKYCSRECYNASKIGKSIHSDIDKLKRSQLLKNKHLFEDRSEIYEKISNSLKFKYSTNDVEKLNKILSTKLVGSINIISEKSGLSQRVIYRIIDENINLKKLYSEKFIATPLHIQKLDLNEITDFIKDIKTLDYYVFSKIYNISEKTMLRLYKFFNIEKYNKKETRPEKSVREILNKLNIEFKKEKYIDKTIRVDFIIGNKIIEVQGDYYHANPEIYKNKNITKIQERNIINDIRKKKFFKENNYELLEIWENEIIHKHDSVVEKIKKYIL